MKEKITPNQQIRDIVYKEIVNVLKQANWTPEEKETDAHAFFSFIQDADNMFGMEVSIAGRPDQSGKVIGHAVGVYTEENYGHVDCDCPRCTERKKNKLKNTNIN